MRNGLTRVCWVKIARLGRIDIPLDSLAHDDQFRPYCSCAPVISIKQQGRKSELGFDQIQDERSEMKRKEKVKSIFKVQMPESYGKFSRASSFRA